MEVCYAVLGEQPDEMQAADRIFAFRRWELGADEMLDIDCGKQRRKWHAPVRSIEGEKLGKVPVKGRHVFRSNAVISTNLKDVPCKIHEHAL